jgi:serine/threonine protein kinase/tetratricopeptide (TPR) repeat protein
MAVDPARAKSLFLNASDLADPAERAAYLNRECGNDDELRNRVEALLRAGEDSPAPPAGSEAATIESDFGAIGKEAKGVRTTNPDLDVSPISITALYDQHPGAEILIAGRYTLQEKIGEGGMGEVWVARQSEPVKRKVALKLIKPGMDSRAVLARFEQERQALAILDHPNIARVLDAGMTPNGQPFFVMELVSGLPLNKFCDELRLTPRERLELFVPICQAVQHAHQKGIVHRDLKPANILITMIDAKPVPKVIDFGVAKATAGKLTDESMSTLFGSVVGTLEYMSPEQAGFSGEDIDTRADIYSLGVILYELLTGLRPVDAARLKKAAFPEMIRIIREEEPPKPSTRLSTDTSLPSLAAMRQTDPRKLMNILRGDLDWVVMKCLEKHRDRRYETANALARDVQRYLSGDAVEACPPSVGYRMRKFVKRNQGPVLAATFVFLALLAGFIGTAYGLFRADRAWRAEAAQRSRAEKRDEQRIEALKKFRDAVANNPELKDNPALDSLRKTLLKQPLAYFEDLRDRLQDELGSRPESLVRIGVRLRDSGKPAEALKAFEAALAIRQKLADANPTVIQFQSELAESHDTIGSALAYMRKPADALKQYEGALAIRQKLADASATVIQFQSDLATSHDKIGLLMTETGKPAEALKAYEAALAIRQKLADANATVIEFQSDLATSHNKIGFLMTKTGKSAEALKAYEAALAVQRKLADANPNVIQFQNEMASSHNNIGLLMNETGRPAQALKACEAALAIRERLAEANPTVTQFQSDLAASHNYVGILLGDLGKPAEALKAHGAALLAIERKLADANPTISRLHGDLAASHHDIGLLLVESGKRADALKAYEAALTVRERLAREHPESSEYASSLGGVLNNIATFDLDSKRFHAARNRLLQAVVWQKKALAANPWNRWYRHNLTNHLAKLIEAASAVGDSRGATDAANEWARLRNSYWAMVPLDAQLLTAQWAYEKELHALAVRFWRAAFANDPRLSDNRQAQHHYKAACAAALAGSGQGKDNPKPDKANCAYLRRQALKWLEAELSAWKRVSRIVAPGNKDLVASTLAHWKQDANLAGIRDERELAKWPEDERAAFKRFWSDVDALLNCVGHSK